MSAGTYAVIRDTPHGREYDQGIDRNGPWTPRRALAFCYVDGHARRSIDWAEGRVRAGLYPAVREGARVVPWEER